MEYEVQLRGRWKLGPQIGKGGFGRVYLAQSEDGADAVAKLVPKLPGAARELLFEPVGGRPNIIPILDSGEWQDQYVLVMPRADTSLRDHLDQAGGSLPIDEAVPILIDIADALVGLDQDVVHRDLKPDNVLLYQGKWCLADFGIARYAAATTAPDTQKFAWTPPYAAPEQWRHERATAATDVYALGVVAFEMLMGEYPFSGPGVDDFREQHLGAAPPALTGQPPSISSLVHECLYKAPQARPTPANIASRLRASQRPASPAAQRLQAVNQQIVGQQAHADAQASVDQSTAALRSDLLAAAKQSFDRIVQLLVERVQEHAPTATVSRSQNLTIRLGQGALAVDAMNAAPADCLTRPGGPAIFDVIAYAAIAARKPRDRFDYEGRSHSLWFCDAQETGVYRWYELAFMVQPLIPQRFTLDPFQMAPTDRDAATALSPVMGTRQVAWGPKPFDQGEEEQFVERWLAWLAAVADESLMHPTTMPEEAGGRWRFGDQRAG